jgi:hypothetical protein
MKKWIFNPFTFIAGGQALLTGLLFMGATAIIAYYSNAHFNGVLDAHSGLHEHFAVYILEQLIAWVIPVLIFYLLAFLLSDSRFRFIDIAGTIALARAPMLLIAIMFFAPALQGAKPGHINNMILTLSCLMLIPVIWMIALMYNAFTVSFNIKGTKAVAGFIGGLVVSEILAVILNQLLQHSVK